ncbi:hypothetical protein WJX84_003220 [Apatococcus fuscideae]|uniref:Uncharacterized protein n=1 Tax=Apatococcus fuscideae TaxID=2026836 RepID=A0AAW1TKU9_9CHLO
MTHAAGSPTAPRQNRPSRPGDRTPAALRLAQRAPECGSKTRLQHLERLLQHLLQRLGNSMDAATRLSPVWLA